jgi:hypothetical protein
MLQIVSFVPLYHVCLQPEFSMFELEGTGLSGGWKLGKCIEICMINWWF